MRVVGTAGHVDHGKSTLIQSMTGIHPDRLKEEQEREMTIDLGFAWVTLPGGEEIGIVDVPGHRDFIENMLAGIGGIDAVIFVVAADEGIMPQTREHLAILDLLNISGGVIALTKVDLIDDPDWLDLVEEEILQVMSGTVLRDAEIIRVSARKSIGIQELLAALAKELRNHPQRLDLGKPRLPVDRIFTMSGFGTVVTGTLSDGILRIGDEIDVLPAGHRGRIRGLQSHKKKTIEAFPGSRTAVNISGVDHGLIKRGDVIAHPKVYQAQRRVDTWFRMLPDAVGTLKHNTEAKFFTGASETMCRVRLLGVEVIEPGQSGWLQLEFLEPVVVVRGDRFILRRPSPSETIGGGMIVDEKPPGRHKRFSSRVTTRLEALARGGSEDIIEQYLADSGPFQLKEVSLTTGLTPFESEEIVGKLFQAGMLVILSNQTGEKEPSPETWMISRGNWDQFVHRCSMILKKFHTQTPLRMGMPREELKSRLNLQTRVFNLLFSQLLSEHQVIDQNGLVKLPDHYITFTQLQQNQINQLFETFAANPFSTPSVKDSQKMVGEAVYFALLDLNELVQVSPDVVFRTADFERIKHEIIQFLRQNGQITVAEMRDQFQSSRKYALAILEYLDAVGITVREGDFRRLSPNALRMLREENYG
jgi:selenocysteine-specific elongation factor